MYEFNEKYLGFDNFKVFYSGNRDVKYLVLYLYRKILIRDYFVRLMFYVLIEGLIGKGRKNSYREFFVFLIFFQICF